MINNNTINIFIIATVATNLVLTIIILVLIVCAKGHCRRADRGRTSSMIHKQLTDHIQDKESPETIIIRRDDSNIIDDNKSEFTTTTSTCIQQHQQDYDTVAVIFNELPTINKLPTP